MKDSCEDVDLRNVSNSSSLSTSKPRSKDYLSDHSQPIPSLDLTLDVRVFLHLNTGLTLRHVNIFF